MDWFLYHTRTTVAIAFAIMAILFCLLAYSSVKEQEQWDYFAKQHKCKLLSEISGTNSSYTIVGANGKVGYVNQHNKSRKTYRCNDGVDYTR